MSEGVGLTGEEGEQVGISQGGDEE